MRNYSFQNKVNNAQGHFLEQYIEAACKTYRETGKANVYKMPEPFRVLKKDHKNHTFVGRFTKKAQPDFIGTLADGRTIVFEAKHTTHDRINQNVLTKEQGNSLEIYDSLGAMVGVCVGMDNQFYFVPWNVWSNMKELYGRKYVTPEDIALYEVVFLGEVRFLDYVHAEMRKER